MSSKSDQELALELFRSIVLTDGGLLELLGPVGIGLGIRVCCERLASGRTVWFLCSEQLLEHVFRDSSTGARFFESSDWISFEQFATRQIAVNAIKRVEKRRHSEQSGDK